MITQLGSMEINCAVLSAALRTWTSLSQARRVSSPCVFSSANWAASLASAGSGRQLRQLSSGSIA